MDDIREALRGVLAEFQQGALEEERSKRGELEKRIEELSRRTEEAERSAAVRAELQRLGVAKIDLAYRVVKDDVLRGEDGRLVARSGESAVGLRDYLSRFVEENPEFLPARIAGGAGTAATPGPAPSGGVDLDKIRPGMSPEELDKVRGEISRIASQTLKGW